MFPLCPPGERPGGHGSPLPPEGGKGEGAMGWGLPAPGAPSSPLLPRWGNCRRSCRKPVPSYSCLQDNCRSICRKPVSSDSCSQDRCRSRRRKHVSSSCCGVLRPQGAPNTGRPAATRAAREGGETGETKEGKREAWASPPCSGPPAEAGGTVGTGAAGPARACQNLRLGAYGAGCTAVEPLFGLRFRVRCSAQAGQG